jgi:N-acetylneuraminate lyase
MNNMKLTGLIAAAHTPFSDTGALNLAIVEKQAAHFLANGLGTIFIGGSTGECHSLSLEERRALAARWFAVANGTPLKLIVHVGSNCLADARVLAAQAEQLGALAISALAPSYFKPGSVAQLVACCADIASAAPATSFYFYDIPGMTGIHLSMPDFLAQAADKIPTLRGIKFTNADLMSYQRCLRAADGAFDVPYGTDEWLLAALALGAAGAVGSSYNFAAPIYHRLIAAFSKGDLAAAREEQFRSVRLITLLIGYGYMGAAKAVMKMLGVDVGPARLPNASLTPAQSEKLRSELTEMGFFDWIAKRP